jgi:hypothetical protein
MANDEKLLIKRRRCNAPQHDVEKTVYMECEFSHGRTRDQSFTQFKLRAAKRKYLSIVVAVAILIKFLATTWFGRH